MSDSNEIRKGVSQSYARAVKKPASMGCCCGAVPEQKGVVVKDGGYTPEELEDLPADAVVNSFGCGNPVAMSALREGDVVLDLGSGAGIDLLLAAKKVGPKGRVIGVDMTDEMISRARANASAAGVANVEVRKGLIEEMPVESGSVDWVISNCVINLSPEKPRAFREIARVLKPGGQMLVSDIVAQEMPAKLKTDPRLYASCISGAISEEDYLSGLRAAGLSDVEVRDRLVYDEGQLEGFFVSEMPDEEGCCGATSSCGCGVPAEDLKPIARSMVGKIWSAKIYARKPR
jgi:SAM-dependent methyltransferase